MTELDEYRELRSQVRRIMRDRWVSVGLATDGADRDKVRAEAAHVLSADFGIALLLEGMLTQQRASACYIGAGVAEELGRALFPNLWLPAWMASVTLDGAEVQSPGAELAWPGTDAGWDVTALDLPTVDRGLLSGHLACALLGSEPQRVVVPAKSDGRCVAAVMRAVDGLSLTSAWTPDEGRELFDLTADVVPIEVIPISDPCAAFGRALAVGVTCLAAEMVGAASYCLDSASSYARSRVQFHRPIGKFQVIRHKLADVLVAIEAARAAVYRAARALDAGAESAQRSARIAKVQAARCVREASEAAVQVHGGMGFTWDVPLHLAVKRWGTATNLFGASAEHAVLIFRELGDTRYQPNHRE